MKSTALITALLGSVAVATSHEHNNNKLTVEPISSPLEHEHGHHVNHHLNKRKHHHHHHHEEPKKKRSGGGQCKFPENEGLVQVTPKQQNAGWAMSPDQPCQPGGWCPYACPPGKLAAQWDPSVTTYSYPGSQNGGLYCEEDGSMTKPFEDKPLCVDGTGKVKVNNKCNKDVAFCQTVLPGNEAMLIPTNVGTGSLETIAVPDPSYWASTAAHYYINPPGVSTEEGCVWGTKDKPWGNWTPYVAGANTDADGNTYVKIGWNPIYLEQATPFRNEKPKFGVRVVCDGGNCNGTPCEIDPRKNGVNEVTSSDSANGAGDGAFCVVTASNGASAHIEVFEVDGSDDGGDDSGSSSSSPSSSSTPESTTSSTSSTPTTTSQPPTTTTSSEEPTTSSSSTKKGLGILNLQAENAVKSSSSEKKKSKATTSKSAATHEVSHVSNLYLTSRTALYNLAQDNSTAPTAVSNSTQGSTKPTGPVSGNNSTTQGSPSGSKNGANSIVPSIMVALLPIAIALF